MTIKQKIQFVRNAQPHCLETLFEMQNRLCDLCGQEIQDLVCATIDHSIPIIRFLHLPLAEAVIQANALTNLRCAHSECNATKGTLSREEWFARGLNNSVPCTYTPAELAVFQAWTMRRQKSRAAAGGRAAGPINGRKNVELQRGIFAPGYDKSTGGRIGGRTNAAKVGFLSRIGKLGGAATVKNHQGLFARTPAQHSADSRKAGLAAGQANIQSGQIQALGRKNVESGHLARVQQLNRVRYFQRQIVGLCSAILTGDNNETRQDNQ